ncbi:ABC transporter permease [Bengtsoniella intestinalis]|uniref:ABC transporter permease n=1 Tax=Bengtsoniella intestinalis TaxID=3073143 RepID=UPI00391F1DBC
MNKNTTKRSFIAILIFLGIVTLIGVFAPYIATHDPLTASLREALLPPSRDHWMGTDLLGRDLFSRVVYGVRTSISISLSLVLITMIGGSFIGIISGYFGGRLDAMLTGISSVMLAFPEMILALAIAGILGRGTLNAFITLASIGWVKYARLSRGIVIKTRNRDFFKAAKVTGSKDSYIMWRYLLPETMPTMLITAAMDIGTVLLSFASLSFLGLGISVETPEWGAMLSEGRAYLETAPWLVIFPGVAIFIVITAFNIFGDTVRDVLDPKNATN